MADYVYYHATESDAGQFAIYDFHFDYRDQNGRCISTDDKKNGNRQQFLYGSRERDNGLVIANLKANLHSVAQAFGAPGYVADLLQDSRSQQILGPYFQYGDLETRLYEYHSPESAYISVSLQNVRKGETISFMLNKLEQRNVRGRFLPASSRVEQTVTLRVR